MSKSNELIVHSGITVKESVDLRNMKGMAIGVACLKHDLVHYTRCGYCYEQLIKLVKCLIENDSEELCADGGVRVIDLWRKDAQTLLNQIEAESSK